MNDTKWGVGEIFDIGNCAIYLSSFLTIPTKDFDDTDYDRLSLEKARHV